MNPEDKVYAQLGRAVARRDELDAEYTTLLQVLQRVLNGELQPQQVVIDWSTRSWSLRELPAPEAVGAGRN